MSTYCIKPLMPVLGGNGIPLCIQKWMKVIRESNEHESIFNGTLIKYFLPHNFPRLKHCLLKLPRGQLQALLSLPKQIFDNYFWRKQERGILQHASPNRSHRSIQTGHTLFYFYSDCQSQMHIKQPQSGKLSSLFI